MSTDAPAADEERCLAFEAHRMQGGTRALAEFLPPAGDPAYAATLEELVAMELELRWKAWARGDRAAAPPPDLAAYADLLAPFDANGVAARLDEEQRRLRTRFAGGRPPESGARVGRYVLRVRVGRGAHAEVWRATDETLGRDVAVKLPRPELADDPLVVARLLREARSAARLRHPGIVSVHEAGEQDGRPYVVSDLVEGETLAAAMRARRHAPDEAAALVLAIAEALDYAHACGVVHRDVKPGNVLLDAAGRPLVADFGVAQLRAAEASLTRPGDLVGTPAYMAPEQVRGASAEPDPRTDVYALGVVLYELLAGRVPFEGTTADSVLYAVVHDDPPPPRALDAAVPADLETVCLRAMAKERALRYPSARALAEDLRRYLDRQPVLARPLGAWGRARLWVRRNPALAGTIAASAAALLAVGGVAFARVTAERDRAQAHLSQALATQAESLAAARDSEWLDRAMRSLREASAVGTGLRDDRRLRDLVLRCHGSLYPSFRRAAAWEPVGGRVASMDASADGTRAAALTRDGVAWVREVPSGRVLARADVAAASPERIAYVRGDALLAVGCADGAVRWLDAATLRERGAAEGGARVVALAASPTDARVAVAREDGVVEILRVADDGAAAERVARLAAGASATLSLAWTPDGTRLAAGGADARLRVWDVAAGRAVADAPVPNAPRTLAVTASGDAVAWGAWENAGWGLVPLGTSGEPVVRNGAHLASVGWIGIDARGRITTASADGTLRTWTNNGTPVAVARGDGTRPVSAAALVPAAGRVVAAYRDGDLVVWDLVAPEGVDLFSVAHTARFVPGGRRVVSGTGWFDVDAAGRMSGSRRVYGRDAIGCHAPHLFPGAAASQPWGVAPSPDGRLVAVATHDGGVRLWTLGDDAPPRVLRERGPVAWACAFSPDGRRVLGCCDGEVVAWDVADGRELARAPIGDRLAVSAAFHPSLPRIVVATMDGELRVLDAATLAPLGFLHRFDGRTHEAVLSPDGRSLAAACDDGTAAVWIGVDRDLAAGAVAERAPDFRVDAGGGRTWAVAFDPSGARFVTGTDLGVVTLHDARTWRSVATFSGDLRSVRSLSFDDAGDCLAAGCYDGTSFLWHLPTLRKVLREMDLDWEDGAPGAR